MMNIQTAYMGEIEINPSEIILFEHGLPGFEQEKEFTLLSLAEESVFRVLQSTKTPELAFMITNPFLTVTDYNFELDGATIQALAIKSEQEVAVFGIVSLKETLTDSTINLKAPIVLNTSNKKAKQMILENEQYAIRHKLIDESQKG